MYDRRYTDLLNWVKSRTCKVTHHRTRPFCLKQDIAPEDLHTPFSNYPTQTLLLGRLSFLLHPYLQTRNHLPSAYQQSVWRLLNPSACLSINSISPRYAFNKKLLLFVWITAQRQHNVFSFANTYKATNGSHRRCCRKYFWGDANSKDLLKKAWNKSTDYLEAKWTLWKTIQCSKSLMMCLIWKTTMHLLKL